MAGGHGATLNPDVAPRMRGVVEKCNFCHGRRHAAEQAGAGAEYTPACAEACPTGAIHFTDLNAHPPAQADTFRLLERLGTDPKIYYHSSREWVANAGAGRARPAVAEAAEKAGQSAAPASMPARMPAWPAESRRYGGVSGQGKPEEKSRG